MSWASSYRLCLLLPLLAPLGLNGQTPSPRELLQQAVERSTFQKDQNHRFTDFDLEHTQNRNEKGKLYDDTTTLYEDTWIADLPFKRVVELNGKPLTGKALSVEQARFDRAVRDRSALDLSARARLIHAQFYSAHFQLDQFADPSYRLTELRQEPLNGQLTRVIDASPIPSTDPLHPTPTRHALLWMTSQSPMLLRSEFDLVGDEPNFLHGSHGQQSYLVLDGVPLVEHALIHFYVLNQGKTITVDTEHTYSKYRRFTATTRMLPPTTATTAPPQM